MRAVHRRALCRRRSERAPRDPRRFARLPGATTRETPPPPLRHLRTTRAGCAGGRHFSRAVAADKADHEVRSQDGSSSA
eukprot:1464414-Pyramimonas_sp.AAC.1